MCFDKSFEIFNFTPTHIWQEISLLLFVVQSLCVIKRTLSCAPNCSTFIQNLAYHFFRPEHVEKESLLECISKQSMKKLDLCRE